MPPKRKPGQQAQKASPAKRRKTKNVVNADGNKRTTFLDLPAEIRNDIYHLALVEDSRIGIVQGSQEPTLLSTCRQIRCEARPIWYFQNRFKLWVFSCRFKWTVRFQRNALQLRTWDDKGRCWTPGADVEYTLTGRKNWDGLVDWCRELHGDHELAHVSQDYDGGTLYSFVAAAHAIAVASRRIDWEECLVALDALRAVLWCTRAKDNSPLFWFD